VRAEEFAQLLRTRPFVPLRIHLSGGKTYDIYHPDLVLVLHQRLDIGVGANPGTGVVDAVDHCSLLHVVRVEELPTPSQPAAQ
jgi:hypothetical protein